METECHLLGPQHHGGIYVELLMCLLDVKIELRCWQVMGGTLGQQKTLDAHPNPVLTMKKYLTVWIEVLNCL
jgi:hypothetical protein